MPAASRTQYPISKRYFRAMITNADDWLWHTAEMFDRLSKGATGPGRTNNPELFGLLKSRRFCAV
jgi:hypothetical protein